MDYPNSKLVYLFNRYKDGSATGAETKALLDLVKQPGMEEAVRDLISKEIELVDTGVYAIGNEQSKERADEMLRKILATTEDEAILTNMGDDAAEPAPHKIGWGRWVAAASIILVLGLGSYFLFTDQSKNEPAPMVKVNDVIAPQTNRAMIRMSDGEIIYLDSAANGTLASQSGINVIKTADGQIIYDNISQGTELAEVTYNTLSNPRGSKVINMTLSDGSRVWLNAGSSVTYPVAFIGNERKVDITGEAYFEVAHNKSKPFFASKGETSVQVLGTQFNVNAYDDEENVKVSLLEGSVRVSKGSLSGMLQPGQQAQIDGTIRLIENADMEQVMAWKNGLFSFERADIKTIMREVSRWYGVDVVYATDVKEHFRLKTSRNTSVSNIFKILETTGAVDLQVDGKKIIVRGK